MFGRFFSKIALLQKQAPELKRGFDNFSEDDLERYKDDDNDGIINLYDRDVPKYKRQAWHQRFKALVERYYLTEDQRRLNRELEENSYLILRKVFLFVVFLIVVFAVMFNLFF